MKKLLVIFVIFLCSINPTLADINLSCATTNYNTNEDFEKDPAAGRSPPQPPKRKFWKRVRRRRQIRFWKKSPPQAPKRKFWKRARNRRQREHFEKEYLTTQLKKHHGNISKTADFIGMERSALHRKLESLGIKGIN